MSKIDSNSMGSKRRDGDIKERDSESGGREDERKAEIEKVDTFLEASDG